MDLQPKGASSRKCDFNIDCGERDKQMPKEHRSEGMGSRMAAGAEVESVYS